MSERYECVLWHATRDGSERAFRGLRSPLTLGLGEVATDLFAAYVREGKLFNPPEVEAIAAALSKEFGKALALFYDNSCGVESAILYECGWPEKLLDEHAEVWLLLDEAGEPDPEAGRFTAEDVGNEDDPDREYARSWSAIDAGLEAFGVGDRFDAEMIKQKVIYDFDY